jgi:hypothetical protein
LLPARCAAWRARIPHLIPLPLAKGRGETNAMGLTTGGHYRPHGIALKSYCDLHSPRTRLEIVEHRFYEIA